MTSGEFVQLTIETIQVGAILGVFLGIMLAFFRGKR